LYIRLFRADAGLAMSVTSVFKNLAFEPETVDVLTSAFEVAWDRVRNSGSPLGMDDAAAATREALAKRIIALAQKGERDRNRLVEGALASLTLSQNRFATGNDASP
jgi:hypothetical protein